MSTRRRRLGLGVALGTATGLVLTLNTASWGLTTDNLVPFIAPGAIEPAGIYQTDNADVWFYMDSVGDYSLNSTNKSVVNNTIDSQYRPTALAFHYDDTPTFSGGGETDHVWQKGLVDGSAEGRAWCNDVNIDVCDQHYIRIETGHYNQGLVCHEMGHAVGLTHGRDASPPVSQTEPELRCLRTPVSSGDILGAHNTRMINGTYN